MTDRQTVMTDWCQEVISVNLCGLETRLAAGRKSVRTGVEEGCQSSAKTQGGTLATNQLIQSQYLESWLRWDAVSYATVVQLLLGAEWLWKIILYGETSLWLQVIHTKHADQDRTEAKLLKPSPVQRLFYMHLFPHVTRWLHRRIKRLFIGGEGLLLHCWTSEATWHENDVSQSKESPSNQKY